MRHTMKSTKNISISLPLPMCKFVEKLAKEESRTISELVREALRQYQSKTEWQKIRLWGSHLAKQKKLSPKDIENLIDEIRK